MSKTIEETQFARLVGEQKISVFDRIWGKFWGINPASGLPMMNQSIDVAGNPFGTSADPHQGLEVNDSFPSTLFDNDTFTTSSDDSFNNIFNNDSFGSDNF